MFQYDENFYKNIEQTKMDEQIIIPLILQWLSPKSIVDFGCAEGAWLREAIDHNSQINILGLDGDYINRNRLKIPEENFMAVDLRETILLGRQFDLAISTEVAEHLENRFADTFIDNITRTSNQILFSAAIPNQGGTNHVNEQWQSYWIEKFEERGYYCDYSVRNFFWNESRISSWRRQNILFFAKERKHIAPERQLADVIHPDEGIRIQKRTERGLEWKMKYYILHPEIFYGLDQMLAKLVRQNKKIVIYPYGGNGKLCEKILTWKYEVEDYLIADNKAKVEGKEIYTAEQLSEFANNISVIDTCSNPQIHREVLDQIKRYVDSNNIYSVF